jgi:hypothetical protein
MRDLSDQVPGTVALFKKKPLKIINGTKIGPDIARAALTEGHAHDKKEPKLTAQFATKIIVATQIRKRSMSGFKPAIQ